MKLLNQEIRSGNQKHLNWGIEMTEQEKQNLLNDKSFSYAYEMKNEIRQQALNGDITSEQAKTFMDEWSEKMIARKKELGFGIKIKNELLMRVVYTTTNDKEMPAHAVRYGGNIIEELDEQCQQLNIDASDKDFDEVVEDITATIHSHPTLSEMVLEAAEAIVGRAIHKKGRPITPRLRDIIMEQFPYEIDYESE